jgi:hypothetical protein
VGHSAPSQSNSSIVTPMPRPTQCAGVKYSRPPQTSREYKQTLPCKSNTTSSSRRDNASVLYSHYKGINGSKNVNGRLKRRLRKGTMHEKCIACASPTLVVGVWLRCPLAITFPADVEVHGEGRNKSMGACERSEDLYNVNQHRHRKSLVNTYRRTP